MSSIRIATCVLFALGCGPSAETVRDEPPVPDTPPAPVEDMQGWPSHLLTSEGSGPALYLHPTPDSPAVGYVSAGVKLRVAAGAQNERLPVWIDGPLKVRGWVPFPRLAARTLRRGRVEGTATYVGPNDVVGVRGLVQNGVMRIEVAPWLGRPNAPTLGTFVGTYPAEYLGTDEVDPATAEQPTPGQAMQVPAGQDVPLYERPGGQVVATLPALTPPVIVTVLRDQGEWKGVRVGRGPYLVGFVNVALTPVTAEPEIGGLVGAAVSESPVPQRLMAEPDRPLWRVTAGSHVKFDGTTIAQLMEDGWAREMNRYDSGEVDVFVAVNDDAAIRGMVDANRLRAVEGQQPVQPAQPVPPPPPAQ